jgi:uncharacterized RDD family membrane protein YckC
MAKLPKPPTPTELQRRATERDFIRAELAALAVRARGAGLLDITLVLDLAMASDCGRGWPDNWIVLPVAED